MLNSFFISDEIFGVSGQPIYLLSQEPCSCGPCRALQVKNGELLERIEANQAQVLLFAHPPAGSDRADGHCAPAASQLKLPTSNHDQVC